MTKINQIWILKNSKDLLEYIQSRSLSSCNSIKTFDFSTLDTTIPHSKMKDKLRELDQLCFLKKNGQRRYKYIVLGRDRSYFVKHHSDSTKQFSETDIFNALKIEKKVEQKNYTTITDSHNLIRSPETGEP
jgi:hypothetical protein